MEKVSRDNPLKKLEGEQLDAFNKYIEKSSTKKLQTARSAMKGIYQIMKTTDMRRLHKNSKDPVNQEKYKAYLNQVRQYESQIALFDYHLKRKKEGGLMNDDEEPEEKV